MKKLSSIVLQLLLLFWFNTTFGQCGIPTGATTLSASTNSVSLTWTAVSGALSYNVQYRIVGTTTWSSATTSSALITLTGLTPVTGYEWQVQAICSSGSSAYSATTITATAIVMGQDRMIMVEVFGSNIFAIDEQGGTTFQRQIDLINYCQSHGIKTLILYKIYKADNSTIVKGSVISSPTSSLNSGQQAMETKLRNFVISAHAAGVTKVAIQASPASASTIPTTIFDNVNQYNKRALIINPTGNACIDMLYIESDWWYSSDCQPCAAITDWNDWFTPGMIAMHQAKLTAGTTPGPYWPLVTGTYISNLNTLNSSGVSPQAIANAMDGNIDIIYIEEYFPAHPVSGNDFDDANPFFSRDASLGQRFFVFSNNTIPSITIPLFSAEASSNSGNNFFGDNMLNADNFCFKQGGTCYSLDDFKNRFETDYNTIVNPYSESAGSSHATQTMNQIIASSSVPNIINNSGVGWFKFGCMPDARHLISLPADQLDIRTCNITLQADEIVTNTTHNSSNYSIPNWLNDPSHGIGTNASPVSYKWYKNGVDQGISTPTCTLQVTNGVEDIWTAEIEFDDPNSDAIFNNLKLRDDIHVKGYTPSLSISADVTTICPNSVVTFTPTSDGVNPSYEWFINGASKGFANIFQTNEIDATADVTAIMTSDALCSGNLTTNSNTITISVFSTTPPTIISLNNNYCSNDASVTLQGNPPGGIFSIDGTTASELNPGILAISPHDVVYTSIDGNSCSTSVTQNVVINDLPPVIVPTSPVDVCVNETAFNLNSNINPNPSSGDFSGSNVSLNGSTFEYNANAAGTGTHVIQYLYTDPGTSCTRTSDITMNVTPNSYNPSFTFSASALVLNIGQQTTLSFNLSPAPSCATGTVQLWWRHDPIGVNTTHLLQNIPCPPCTLDIVPSGFSAGGDDFIENDELYLVYIPCDCAAAQEFTSNSLAVSFSPGCYFPTDIFISDINYATCPNYDNGSVTVSTNYGSGYLRLFKDGLQIQQVSSSTPATFNGLTGGIYTVAVYTFSGVQATSTTDCLNGSNYQYNITKDFFVPTDNILNPVIQSINSNLNCDRTFSVLNSQNYNSIRWFYNGNPIPNETLATYTAPINQSGDYSVEVEGNNHCGHSNSLHYSVNLNATISGGNTNCGSNVYSVPQNGNNSLCQWTVPAGASFVQNGNSITVNWGTAYITGGTISCTVVDVCGNTAFDQITVASCCNLTVNVNVNSTCNGLNNGIITASPVSGTSPYQFSWSPLLNSSPVVSNVPAGIYSLTVTDKNGCQSTVNNITVSNSQLITYDVKEYQSCTGMNNGSLGVANVNHGVGPYTYLWNNLQQTAIITNLLAGTYSVTVTDSRGCSVSKNKVVNNFPSNLPTPIISGSTSACGNMFGSNRYTIPNFNSTYADMYSWTVVPNSGSATITYPQNIKSSAVINWQNTDGGKIIVSFGPASCCMRETLYVQGCCTNTHTYYDGQASSNLFVNSNISLSGMVFNGNFIIDENLTLNNCGIVEFAPGSQLTVNPGVTLTINNCTLTSSGSCCKMWKGIVLKEGAKIEIKNNSTISEAEIGLMVNDKSTYNISQSHFRNNYIGIKIGNGIQSVDLTGSSISSTEFYSDVFSCSSTNYNCFVPQYDGQTTVLGIRPYAGIYINLCSFVKIGKTPNVAGGDIRFYNLSNGIISHNSNLYVSNTSLENCNYGVVNNKGNCDVSLVASTPDNNTVVYLSDTKKATVTDNCIQGMKYGVFTYHNPDADILIDKNDFRMSTTKNSIACVRTDEFSLGNKIVISNNTMKLNLAAFGVVNYELSAGEIKQNSIEMNNNANLYGIMVYAGGKNVYKCNSVNALQTYNNPQVGIAVSSSRANELSCNWVNRQQNGINFYGACNDTRLRGNSMNNHDIGLGIYYDGIIGVQKHNGNTWNGTMSSYGAYLSGIDQNLADLNKFYYLSSGTNNYPTVTNDPGYDWFQIDNDGEEFSCAKFDCLPTIPHEEEEGKPEDGEIAVNSGNSDPISQATNYFADRFLFEKLKSNSDLLLNNPILQAFFSQQLSGNIGVFSELDEEIADAVRWETVYALTYSTNATMIKNATDSINNLDSLLQLDPNNAALKDQMIEINERIKITQESNRLIYETIKQIQDFKKANALSGNGAVITNEVYEINEAKINEIYLNTVAKGVFSFDSYQTNEIVGIMNQCPYIGGNAVYEAHSLYSLIDPDYVWNDYVICALGGISPRLSGGKIDKVFSVYPNPTTGIINLTYEIENDQSGEIIITDALGVKKAVVKIDHNNSEMNINLSDLAPGIYYYSILVNSIPEKNGVITIIK
ncbi:MAG: T9SS type A sorting domain-containing protein [Bacteroidetes bacterium]|nr:T9SS type A sorting domain-containing protein [Bacteroidota bacterium]